MRQQVDSLYLHVYRVGIRPGVEGETTCTCLYIKAGEIILRTAAEETTSVQHREGIFTQG